MNNNIDQYLRNYYKEYNNLYDKCSMSEKGIILFIRSIQYIIIFMILFGIFLPKQHLLIHITLCFIVLYDMYINKKNNILNKCVNNILNKYNVNNKKKFNFSLLPIEKNKYKFILICLITISILSYIYPNYSLYNMLSKLNKKINTINQSEVNINDYYINKSNNIKSNNNIKSHNINNNIKNNNLVDLQILNETNNTDNNIDSKIGSSIYTYDMSSNLNIFENKIKPINIKIDDIVPKKRVDNPNILKNKLKESLRKFNDIII